VYPTPAPPALREGAACLTMHMVGEQAPNLDSRVTLAEERDALGLRKLRLHLAFGELDRRTVEEGAMLLARELGRLGAGRVRIGGQATGGVFPKGMWPAAHHMGATRMSDDPSAGVVDAQGRVHGIGNLYVAGSSVFPTGGYANPTVNLVALTMRLGDELGSQL
jgi:choline dehydrogenase-like flavoprotein